MGNCIKVSLHHEGKAKHQTGGYRYSFTHEFRGKMKGLGRTDLPNPLVKWNPYEVSRGCNLAVQVIVPPSVVKNSLSISKQKKREVYWVPSPIPTKAVEFSVLITSPECVFEQYPYSHEDRVQLVDHLARCNGDEIWVIHRTVDYPRFGNMKGQVHPLMPLNNEQENQDDFFAIARDIDKRGVLSLIEARVENTKNLTDLSNY